MSTIKRIVAAVGALAALAASAGPAIAAAPAVPATPANVPPAFVPPADYMRLTDDTGTITVAVPTSWSDVITAPVADAAGNTIPRISAATDYDVFVDTFDAPGVEYVALPFNADHQAVMTQYGLSGGCAKTETVPYDDGAFTGLHGIWSECGTTGVPEWHQIVVAPADNSRTLMLQIQLTGPADAPALQNILDSFDIGPGTPTTPTVATGAGASTVPLTTAPAGSTLPLPTVPGIPTVPTPTVTAPGIATVPTPTVAGIPTIPTPTVVATVATLPAPTVAVPTVPVPTVAGVATTVPVPTVAGVPTTVAGAPTGAVPAGFVQLVDDTQSISMVVPATWTDVDTAPLVADDGRQTASIIASTNIDQWETTITVPGAQLVLFPFVADPPALIADLGLDPGTCPSETVEPFSNGVYTGTIGRWSSCGANGQAEYDVIVASPADQSATFVLMVLSTGPADQAAVATVIGSFGPATVGGGATATSVALPSATNPLPTVPGPSTVPGG